MASGWPSDDWDHRIASISAIRAMIFSVAGRCKRFIGLPAMLMRLESVALQGDLPGRAVSLARLAKSVATVVSRRAISGPLRPTWPYEFELVTHFFQSTERQVLRIVQTDAGISAARRLIDALVF